MPKARVIKNRIKGVKNIQEITRAMKLVAAARIKRAEDRVVAARPYAEKMRALVAHLITEENDDEEKKPLHPLMIKREPERICIVPVSGDKGLCGAFNNNIFRAVDKFISSLEEREIFLVPLGNKSYKFYSSKKFNIPFYYQHLSDINYSVCKEMAGKFIKLFMDEEIDELYFIYGKFVSTMSQEVNLDRLIPFAGIEEGSTSNMDYIFEPSRKELIDYIIPRYVEGQIYQIILESVASELGARLMAMTNATDNADDLIGTLTLQFYRARQEAITTQILEITGGAEAIKR